MPETWDSTRLFDGVRPTLYKGTGCRVCSDTGYRGRIPPHEVMLVIDDLAAAFGRRASVDEVRKLRHEAGMRTLHEDGLIKVSLGLTSMEELLRVLAEHPRLRGRGSSTRRCTG